MLLYCSCNVTCQALFGEELVSMSIHKFHNSNVKLLVTQQTKSSHRSCRIRWQAVVQVFEGTSNIDNRL